MAERGIGIGFRLIRDDTTPRKLCTRTVDFDLRTFRYDGTFRERLPLLVSGGSVYRFSFQQGGTRVNMGRTSTGSVKGMVCATILVRRHWKCPMTESIEITRLLNLARQGDRSAEQRLLDALYTELRRIASACLRSERKGHTLQATALVHEAYLRLASQRDKEWKNRTHFLAVAAQAMRRVLVDCARARYAKKRGGDMYRVEFDANLVVTENWAAELLDIDVALSRLAELDERQAKVVEMRFFAGLTEPEIAQLLGISERTVKREWEFARAWLEGELSRSSKTPQSGKANAIRE